MVVRLRNTFDRLLELKRLFEFHCTKLFILKSNRFKAFAMQNVRFAALFKMP